MKTFGIKFSHLFIHKQIGILETDKFNLEVFLTKIGTILLYRGRCSSTHNYKMHHGEHTCSLYIAKYINIASYTCEACPFD